MKSVVKTVYKSGINMIISGALALALVGIGCSSTKAEREPQSDTSDKMEMVLASADSTKSGSASKSDTMKTRAGKTSKAKAKMTAMEGKYEAEVRDEKNHIVKIETNFGDMILELYRDVAPNHADSFYARAEEGFYDGTIFHRVIKGFMIQGGDPTGTGMGDPEKPGYMLDAEFSKLKHKRGTLSMARMGRGPASDPQGFNTASCQFFICHGDAFFLDGKYTVFGNLLAGYDVMDKIADTKKGANDRPVEEVKIIKVSIIK